MSPSYTGIDCLIAKGGFVARGSRREGKEGRDLFQVQHSPGLLDIIFPEHIEMYNALPIPPKTGRNFLPFVLERKPGGSLAHCRFRLPALSRKQVYMGDGASKLAGGQNESRDPMGLELCLDATRNEIWTRRHPPQFSGSPRPC